MRIIIQAFGFWYIVKHISRLADSFEKIASIMEKDKLNQIIDIIKNM